MTEPCFTVLVCGGRDYKDGMTVASVLEGLREQAVRRHQRLVIVEGGGRGTDTLARLWAAEQGISVVTFFADWAELGPSAGPVRNQRMLTEGHPDLVVAFPGGRGTADMVRRAERAEVPVRRIVTE